MGFDAPVAAVRRALEDAGLFRGGTGLLCGVSGGADSVALLWPRCGACGRRRVFGWRPAMYSIACGARLRWRTKRFCARARAVR